MSNSALGYAGLFNTFLGGITSAIGSIFSGQAQKEMYDYQAGVARLNQIISEQNAVYAEQVGELQAERYGLQARQQLGQIKTAQASSGLDIRSGTPKAVYQSQRELSQMDMTTIRSNAAKTAYNYRVQGVQYQAQAGLDTIAGQNAMAAGFVGAESSIIGGATGVASQWLQGQRMGLWSAGGSAMGA